MSTRRHGRGARIRVDGDGRNERHIPLGDLILQTELRVATSQNIASYPCPCRDCRGSRRRRIHVIREHHRKVGRHPCLSFSMVGGDPPNGYPEEGMWVEDIAYDDDVVKDAPNIADDVLPDVVGDVRERNHVAEDTTPLDANHDIQR